MTPKDNKMLKAAQDMASTSGAQLVTELQQIVGNNHVLTEDGQPCPTGAGSVLARGVPLRSSCLARWWSSGACCRPA